jgi:hypothetical protein
LSNGYPRAQTLEVGIGGIPNALMGALHNRRDLGVHTELIRPQPMHDNTVAGPSADQTAGAPQAVGAPMTESPWVPR